MSHHDQTKVSPVFVIYMHVDGEAKNFSKSSNAYISIVLCYGLSRVVDTVSLCAEICENKDYKTEGQVRPGCNACSLFGVEREFYRDWRPLPLVWNHVTRRPSCMTKQYKFFAEFA